MKKSARIAAAAHVRAMRNVRPGMNEHEVEADLLHEFRRHGAVASYEPIVGGGANACVLHYRANNAPLRDGDLLLIDAGAEYQCYASDITRTFPVNGTFTTEQRAIYDIVLAAQTAAIDEVRAGRSFDAYHEAAVRVITKGLIKLGLLEGSLEKNLRDHTYRTFYMHKTGHWLGLDVHDVGDYRIDGEFRLLEPGMVVTVEPGIYIAPDLRKVPARYRGIGIRIEDDVVVTRGDPENPHDRRAARSRRDRSADGVRAMSLVHALLAALLSLFGTSFARGAPAVETLDYGLFGTLHLTRPAGDVASTVLFFSDRDGWTARQADLSVALAARGAFVVGIDLPAYLAKLATISGKCSYPAGHVEEVAHWIERHEGFATYTYPAHRRRWQRRAVRVRARGASARRHVRGARHARLGRCVPAAEGILSRRRGAR